MTRLTFYVALLALLFPASVCLAGENDAAAIRAASQSEREPNPAIGQVLRDCADCPQIVAVPQVGHTKSSPGKIFYAGRYEVTWAEYLIAVREGACPRPAKPFGGLYDPGDAKINDRYPLTGSVGPETFKCYLEWLHKKTNKTYRIPTAEEWEHIARAGTTTTYYWGDSLGMGNAIVFDFFDLQALRKRLGYPKATFFLDDSRSDVKWGRVYPVGQFSPNPWGLYDVIGNASEVTTERLPPVPRCVKARSLKVCEAFASRGGDQVRSPDPSEPNPPITESLTTTRYRAPAHGESPRTGFRLVRD